ncbi:hypothetical protein [Mesorhizobium sp. A623]
MRDMESKLEAMRMLEGMLSRDRMPERSILPEAKIARLREAAERFTGENPFKVGDIVTVREDAPIIGAGDPHLVIESGSDDLSTARPEDGSWTDSVVRNVRLIRVREDDIIPMVVPHWSLEPYEG